LPARDSPNVTHELQEQHPVEALRDACRLSNALSSLFAVPPTDEEMATKNTIMHKQEFSCLVVFFVAIAYIARSSAVPRSWSRCLSYSSSSGSRAVPSHGVAVKSLQANTPFGCSC
jgi:hypothetical protein